MEDRQAQMIKVTVSFTLYKQPLLNFTVLHTLWCKLVTRRVWRYQTWLVIGTSRTVGSAKNFVRITSGVGGGEFTKTLRKVCTCQKLKFSFLLLEYCKIRECYAVTLNLHLCQEQLRNARVSQFSSCFSLDDWFCESYTSYTRINYTCF
jgi:hypothetical protein